MAHQYVGNLGKIANGIVSVNAYGVLDNVTFPLLFSVFKPRKRLHPTDVYKPKPYLARELIQEIRAAGFQVDLVLADCLYGESGDFITELLQLKLPFVVAIRRNHGVRLGPNERVRAAFRPPNFAGAERRCRGPGRYGSARHSERRAWRQ